MSDLGGFSLFELFKAEAETHCATLNEGLLRLEADASDLAAIEPLMRAAHSLKGAARIIGVDLAVKVAHAMEDCLVAAQKGQEVLVPARIDQLLQGTDLLTRVGQISEAELPAFTQRESAMVEALVEAFRQPPPAGGAAAGSAAPVKQGGGEGAGGATAGVASVESSASAPSDDASTPPVDPTQPRVEPEARPASPAVLPPAPPAAAAAESAAVAPASTPSTPQRPAAPPPAPPAPAARAAPARAAASSATEVKTLRVNAANLDRMMRLAGEMMVESRRFESLRESVRRLKSAIESIDDLLDGSRRGALLRTLEGAVESAVENTVENTVSGLDGRDGRAIRAAIARLQQEDTRVAGSIREGVVALQRTLLAHAGELESNFRRSEEVATALYHEVLGSRMRPFSDGTAGLPRMVRDLAKSLGKQVRFEIRGGTVPVDRDILAKLEAPLNHMLRNCVDHGVESPAERSAAGKDPTAEVYIEARHHGGMLQVKVGDDGRGIDPQRIRRKVVEKGLQSGEIVAGLSNEEVLDFLFLPGFSTASQVTEVSGRGVGLDVVQTMVQETGGSLRVESEPGRGAAFAMRLPITLSVIRAALVEIGGEPYAFPLSRLERVVKVPHGELRPVEGRQQFELDGVSVGLVHSTAVLGLPGAPPASEVASVMVVGQHGEWLGLLVDRFLGEEDLVVRPLDPRLGRVPHIASAALLEDGRPLLIVDTDDLIASVRLMLGEGRLRGARVSEQPGAKRRKRVLVVEDSITVREVERQLLARLGYEVDVAVDGVDGWNALQVGSYDLMVSDIDMPRMNGLELVRTARADPRFRTLPIVIVSYKDREEDRRKGMEVGANAYLTKGSFHDRSFAQTVQDLIGPGEE